MRALMLYSGYIGDPKFCGVFLRVDKMEEYKDRAKKLGVVHNFLPHIDIDIERDFYIPREGVMYKVVIFKSDKSPVIVSVVPEPHYVILCNRMSTIVSSDASRATVYMWSISPDTALIRAEHVKATMDHEELWIPKEHFDFAVMA